MGDLGQISPSPESTPFLSQAWPFQLWCPLQEASRPTECEHTGLPPLNGELWRKGKAGPPGSHLVLYLVPSLPVLAVPPLACSHLRCWGWTWSGAQAQYLLLGQHRCSGSQVHVPPFRVCASGVLYKTGLELTIKGLCSWGMQRMDAIISWTPQTLGPSRGGHFLGATHSPNTEGAPGPASTKGPA